MSPSRAAVGSPAGILTVSPSSAPALFGASAVDFARCLQAAEDPGCFAAARMQPLAVGAAATAPGGPINLSASSSGSTVTLTWGAPASGDPVTTYLIEAGSSPGLANLANVTTNSTGTSFSASGVGAGTYYVRIRAQNNGGVSGASNEAILIVGASGCTAAPNAPGGLAITSSGSTVMLAWNAPAGGCAPTSYVLQAGSSAGASDLANSNVGNTTSYVATGVGNGTYYVRVRAANAFGQSTASNEFTLLVGGGPAPSPGGITGRWVGLAPDGLIISSPDSCDAEQDIQLDLVQRGSSFTGTATGRVRKMTTPAPRGVTCDYVGFIRTDVVDGTVSGSTVILTTPGEGGRAGISYQLTINGSRLSGNAAGLPATLAVTRQ